MAHRKTLNDLIESDKDTFTANDVCGVLACDPNTLRLTARQQPQLLQFRVNIMGNRVKIPRYEFLISQGVSEQIILSRRATNPAS